MDNSLNYYKNKYIKYKLKYKNIKQIGGENINIIKPNGEIIHFDMNNNSTIQDLVDYINEYITFNFSLVIGIFVFYSDVDLTNKPDITTNLIYLLNNTRDITLVLLDETENIDIFLDYMQYIFEDYDTYSHNNPIDINNIYFTNPDNIEFLLNEIEEACNILKSTGRNWVYHSQHLYNILYAKINKNKKTTRECINKILEKYPYFIRTDQLSDDINYVLVAASNHIHIITLASDNIKYLIKNERIDGLSEEKQLEFINILRIEDEENLPPPLP